MSAQSPGSTPVVPNTQSAGAPCRLSAPGARRVRRRWWSPRFMRPLCTSRRPCSSYPGSGSWAGPHPGGERGRGRIRV